MFAVKHVGCPYCGEEILASARKCRHCGEWLEDTGKKNWRGSSDARAVTKGLKEKERQDSAYKFFIFLSLVLGAIVWSSTKEFWWGFGAFFGAATLSAWWYYKE